MSAFLGPIHSLMYNRIITMQQVINAIAELTEAEGWNVDVNAFVIKEFLRRRRQAREDAEMFA